MEKVLIENVRIGILDNNSKFVMSTFVDGLRTYFQVLQADDFEYSSKIEILGYEISNDNNESKLNLFSSDGTIYCVNSFSEEFVEYLNRLYFNLTEMIRRCKVKYKSNITGCKISELSLIVKILGKEIFIPPVIGMKMHGYGNIIGHKYLKNGFGKTSKIVEIDTDVCSITSTRTIYDILSLLLEYENYLIEMTSEIETILKQYSK